MLFKSPFFVVLCNDFYGFSCINWCFFKINNCRQFFRANFLWGHVSWKKLGPIGSAVWIKTNNYRQAKHTNRLLERPIDKRPLGCTAWYTLKICIAELLDVTWHKYAPSLVVLLEIQINPDFLLYIGPNITLNRWTN